MLNSRYHRGVISLIHDNGRGRAYWDHHNITVTLKETLANCYFDLGNKNRGSNPMYKVGHIINIEASDGFAQVRVMSMGPDFMGIEVRALTPPVYFDDDADFGMEAADDAPLEVKRGRGRPKTVNPALADA